VNLLLIESKGFYKVSGDPAILFWFSLNSWHLGCKMFNQQGNNNIAANDLNMTG
jgi:hypothetical protein